MVQSLEQYVAQATQAYQPSTNAIQSQIDALAGRLDTTNEQINRNYARQQSTLNRQRNDAAYSASINAAANGAGFGGMADIANQKYYSQQFVPAVTQLQTNQANDLAQARQNVEDQRTSLNAQRANLESQWNQQALAQYYNDLNAEREREFQAQQAELNRQAQLKAQREAAAAQNAYYKYMMDAMKNSGNSGVKSWNFGNGYALTDNGAGQAVYTKDGRAISAGDFLVGTGSGGANWNLWNDVWNNGVSTKGVGSDTVQALSGINRLAGTAASVIGRYNPQYSYLFK